MAQSGCHRQGSAIFVAEGEELLAKLGWVGGGKGWSVYNGPLHQPLALFNIYSKEASRRMRERCIKGGICKCAGAEWAEEKSGHFPQVAILYGHK